MRTRPGRRRRPRGGVRRLAVAGLMATLCATATGCTTARDTLGTHTSACFEALAIAKEAVHGRGSYSGVSLISITTLAHDAGLNRGTFGSSVHDVCVVSWKGTFRTSDVEHPLGAAPKGGVAHEALVIVSKPQNKLLGTVLRARKPVRFRDLF